jgi:thymidylate synthase (FAD)
MGKTKLIEIGNFPDICYNLESRRTIEEILKPFDVSFSVENVSRATTHEICESNDSYTQQSMRYVKMGKNAFIVPPVFSNSLKKEFSNTMNFLLDNYVKLSEIKNEFKDAKGRPKPNWFKFAPIEDNRYALSLATPSNILVTMNGGQLLNFFGSLTENFESKEIFDSLAPYLPNTLAKLCYNEIGSKNFSLIEKIHKNKLDQGLEGTFANIKHGRFERTGLGALTSTSAKTPSELVEIYNEKGIKKEELEGVAKRVLGYGHESVVEHAKAGCSLGASLVTYHQFERHRIPTNVREDFRNLPLERRIILPPKIGETQEGTDIFYSSVNAAKNVREKIMNDAPEYNHFGLLNGAIIGIYSNMNARAFYHIANERLCNNAQWEIQGLMEGLALQLREKEPDLYRSCTPKCISQGKCPEGKLTCGKYGEIKAKYLKK